MDAKYLDSLLEVLKSKNGQSMTYAEFACTPNVHSVYENSARIELENRGFIYQTEDQPFYLGITGAGLLFINQGGFQKEEQLNNLPFETVKIARQSKTLSIIAIIMSVLVAIAVAYFQFRTKA